MKKLPGPLVAALALGAVACADAVGPADAGECLDDTGAVTVSVGSGLAPAFDWSPRCPVALILVEEDASDMWAAGTDEALWYDPAAANAIDPPVTYGVTPSGATYVQDPLPLVSDHTYDVILWRILPASSTAPCVERFREVCPVVVHAFSR